MTNYIVVWNPSEIPPEEWSALAVEYECAFVSTVDAAHQFVKELTEDQTFPSSYDETLVFDDERKCTFSFAIQAVDGYDDTWVVTTVDLVAPRPVATRITTSKVTHED